MKYIPDFYNTTPFENVANVNDRKEIKERNRNSDLIPFPMAIFGLRLKKIDSDSSWKIPAENAKNKCRNSEIFPLRFPTLIVRTKKFKTVEFYLKAQSKTLGWLLKPAIS